MNDKAYVKNGIKISFTTAAVATLEILENEFGHLWGHGKDWSNLTEDEEQFRECWDRVRSSILNESEKAKKITLGNVDKYSIRKRKIFQDFR